MLHTVRIWVDQNRSHASAVLLRKDVRNAFNEVRPQEFLKDCRDYAPASSRFAHYCYGESSHLVYAGILESYHRGQQGCPLRGSMLCMTRRRIYDESRAASSCPSPVLDVEFVDDA